MALPIVAAIVLGAAVYHEVKKSHYEKVEFKRKTPKPDAKNSVLKSPSDSYASNIKVQPKSGSIVCCGVYGVLDHTAIWIDRDTIIELSNNGLVKAVSAERFLEERSGDNIFVACDHKHDPLVFNEAIDRAINSVFTYRGYDVIDNNCHRFVNYCITGQERELTRFNSLNDAIFKVSGKNIYWDKVKIY